MRRAAGLCVQCGQPAAGGRARCPRCEEKKLTVQRVLGRFNAWVPGGRGRPPRRIADSQLPIAKKQTRVRPASDFVRLRRDKPARQEGKL